jgi:hypothetical protein
MNRVLQIVCGLIALVSLAAVAWVLITGQIGKQGLDALFLVLVCLLFVVMFLPIAIPPEMMKKLIPRKGVKHESGKGA